MGEMNGVYLPLVTPFYDGYVDLQSLERLVAHYAGTGIAGIVLLRTTGESPTVDASEQKTIVEAVIG